MSRNVARINGVFFGLLFASLQQDPRQIVEEAQRRTTSQSQKYEGTLRVIDAKNKITEKRWLYDRIGSHGWPDEIWEGVNRQEIKLYLKDMNGRTYGHVEIATPEGVMRGDVGDWIVRGIKGEFYPVKPDIFAATYEPVIDQGA